MSTTAQGSARSRINALLDDNSFVEIGGAVTARTTNFSQQTKETPADGVVTGYGVINGNLVYVYSQDASVLNGSVGEMHAKKIAHLYDLALKMGAPVIGLLDSAGLRLQELTDALNGFGRIYQKATLASGVIPQITAVFGNCGGGLAILASLSDFTFMEEKKAKLFVNSPNALDGNYASKLDTAAAAYQSENTANVDFVGDEDAVLNGIRDLVSILPSNNEDEAVCEVTDDLNRAVDSIENGASDPAIMLPQLSDGNVFFEVGKNHCKGVVTGFIKMNGATIGAVAKRTELFDEEGNSVKKYDGKLCPGCAEKAADFINFCDAFGIPVLTIVDVDGFVATEASEKVIAKSVAKLTYAYANATVPKVSLVIGKALGSASIVFGSKSIGADLYYAWNDAQIGVMDSNEAARIIVDDLTDTDAVRKASEEFASLQSSQTAAARGVVDDLVDPVDTRKYLVAAFEMLYTKRENRPDKKHGTV
ncbi:MAG: carboxyl transferase [Lachnospiraceae bacterium]|nr:carboxyl transferase [Lachnospiraceae bacterium]